MFSTLLARTNYAYIYCVWRFCSLFRCNDSDTTVGSSHTVVTELTTSPFAPQVWQDDSKSTLDGGDMSFAAG